MIFVTLGSQKFQFNRLLKKIDDLISQGIITEPVFAQSGASDYKARNFKYKDYLSREEFDIEMNRCDMVITHGGTGAIIGAVKKGKKVIAIPRLEKYGEHVDDHQVQLLKQFDGMGIIKACYRVDDLKETYLQIGSLELVPYVSNTNKIIESIYSYLKGEKN